MLGSINDPEDGKAIAATVFGAVVVYIVSSPSFFLPSFPPPPLPPCLLLRADEAAHRASLCSVLARPGFTADSVPSSYADCKPRSIYLFSRTAMLYWEQEHGVIHVVIPDPKGGMGGEGKRQSNIRDISLAQMSSVTILHLFFFFTFFLFLALESRLFFFFPSWTCCL